LIKQQSVPYVILRKLTFGEHTDIACYPGPEGTSEVPEKNIVNFPQ